MKPQHKPSKLKIIEIRPDGLPIFFDQGDHQLNSIRMNGTKEEVIMAVAMRRAHQIAIDYTAKYAPELLQKIIENINKSALPLSSHELYKLRRIKQ